MCVIESKIVVISVSQLTLDYREFLVMENREGQLRNERYLIEL